MYTWPGMKKITWAEVNELAMKGKLVGCYLLYGDNTEGMITIHTNLEEIMKHYNDGGEFGIERAVEKVMELCSFCNEEVEINSIGVQTCPNCRQMILPCCVCEECNPKCIYSEEETYKLFKDEKENFRYWSNLAVITNRYIDEMCGQCINDINREGKAIASAKLLNMSVEMIKSVGGIFPTMFMEGRYGK